MKIAKIVVVLAFLLVAVTFVAAAEVAHRPYAEGRDVILPDQLVKNIPGYDPNKPVFVAYDDNEWFVTDAEHQKYKPTLVKEGNGSWRAPGMRGQRFHPVQLDASGNPKWALVEKTFNVPPQGTVKNGIDHTNPNGPCILVP